MVKYTILMKDVGRDSSVGVATRYGLEGPGIEFRWGRDFPHLSRPALGTTQPPVQWVEGLSRGQRRPGRGTDHPPHLVQMSRKIRAIPLLSLWVRVACYRMKPLPCLTMKDIIFLSLLPTRPTSASYRPYSQRKLRVYQRLALSRSLPT
jgi:hypothetical protein